MDSKIAAAVNLELQPVALIWSDEKPANATEFAPGRWSCVMFLMAAAAKGRTAVAGRDTYGCWGGGVGLGFGNIYKAFPGGEGCFYSFLSSGNAGTGTGRAIGSQMEASGAASMADEFLQGERYLKTPQVAEKFVACLPIMDIPAKYVVFKPLSLVKPDAENVRSITFFADPDQLAALTVLANYDGEHNQNVVVPFAAGCQAVGICTFKENESPSPRAVIGLIDLSARENIRRQLGGHVMSFSVTPDMFRRMENDVEGSFLQRNTWKAILQHRLSGAAGAKK